MLESYTPRMNVIKPYKEKYMLDDQRDLFAETLANQQQQTMDVLEEEMQPGSSPSADIIIIMTKKEEDKQFYDKLFAQTKKIISRPDVPVITLPYEGLSDARAPLNAHHYLHDSQKMQELAKQYPLLRGKSLEQLRVVIMKTDGEDRSRTTFQFPVQGDSKVTTELKKKTADPQRGIMNIEYQLFNAYKAAHIWKQNNEGGIVYIDAAMRYDGPVQQRGDVTLVGSWVSYQQSKDDELGVMMSEDDERVGTFYESHVLDPLADTMEKRVLQGAYDSRNRKKRQIPVYARITLISFKQMEQWDHFNQVMNNVYNFDEETHLSSTKIGDDAPGLSFNRDILIPLTRKSRGSKILTYLDRRDEIVANEALYLLFHKLFRILDNGHIKLPPFDFRTFMPPLNQTRLSRNYNPPAHAQPGVTTAGSTSRPQTRNTLRVAGKKTGPEKKARKPSPAATQPQPPKPLPSKQAASPLAAGVNALPETSPLAPARTAAGAAIGTAAALLAPGEPANSLDGKTAVFVYDDENSIVRALMAQSPGNNMNALGISLVNSDLDITRAQNIGRIIVPIETADVLVQVWAQAGYDKGKSIRLLLRPVEKQESVPAQNIADMLLAPEEQGTAELRQNRRNLLLGRGSLAVIKDIQSGTPTIKDGILATDGLDLPYHDIEPAVVHLAGVPAVYALPSIVIDRAGSQNRLTNDPFLNSMVYSVYEENLSGADQRYIPISFLNDRDSKTATGLELNPEIFDYSVMKTEQGRQGRRLIDLTTAMLVFADMVIAESDDDDTVSGAAAFPEFEGLINEVKRSAMYDDPAAVKKYIMPLWAAMHGSKEHVAFGETKRQPHSGEIISNTHVASLVSVRSYKDIEEAATALNKAGVDTMEVKLSPAATTDGSASGVLSGVGLDLSYIGWLAEADHVLSGSGRSGRETIDNVKTLVPESVTTDDIRADGLTDNQFTAGLLVYQAFKQNKRAVREFTAFKKRLTLWPQVAEYAQYLAAARITGTLPESLSVITGVHKTDIAQWLQYPEVYEYMYYVAFKQLREAVGNARKTGTGMKVLFSYTPGKARNAVDVLFHPEQFKEGVAGQAGDLISPTVNGEVQRDLVMYSWHALENLKFKPVKAEVAYWYANFGFDGVTVSGINAYNRIYEAGFTPDILFTELADTVHAINPDAIIVVEPFDGFSVSPELLVTRNLYKMVTIKSSQPQEMNAIRAEASKNGRIWFTTSDEILRDKAAFREVLKHVSELGVPSYFSFPLDSAQLKNANPASITLIDFLDSLQYILASPGSDSAETAFRKGYTMFGQHQLSAEAIALVSENLHTSERSVLKYNDGKNELADIRAPGLHVVLQEYAAIKAAGHNGNDALLYKAENDDSFARLYTILNGAGLTQTIIP
ncbi:MAG: hypothetical protein ABSH12_08860, partial [Endomicrobiales bacterium]